MKLARVIGTVTSTVKVAAYRSQKLLLVRPVDPGGSLVGGAQIAVDRASAGVGDTVLLLDEGNSARMMLGDSMAPVRTIVVGVVDAVNPGEGMENNHGG